MDWMQVIVLVGSLLATILGVVIPFHVLNLNRLDAIHQEMKDFHGRLVSIEERAKLGKKAK